MKTLLKIFDDDKGPKSSYTPFSGATLKKRKKKRPMKIDSRGLFEEEKIDLSPYKVGANDHTISTSKAIDFGSSIENGYDYDYNLKSVSTYVETYSTNDLQAKTEQDTVQEVSVIDEMKYDKFLINLGHSRGEKGTLRRVIDQNLWEEVSGSDGDLIWFGTGLSDGDL